MRIANLRPIETLSTIIAMLTDLTSDLMHPKSFAFSGTWQIILQVMPVVLFRVPPRNFFNAAGHNGLYRSGTV
jgi:hypothetical protein